jgi:hypothetical protein
MPHSNVSAFSAASSTNVSAIILEALRLGTPKRMLLRMLYNMGLDVLLGAAPVVGDVFDIVWKANKKNVALLDEHLQRRIASNDVTYDAL